jgi:predicted amidophosphoribosyltransferase
VGARELFEEILDLVFPRRCVQCRTVGAWLCAACAAKLTPLPAERCPRCGAPTRCPVRPGVREGRAGRCDPEEPEARDAHDGRPACAECRGRDLAFEAAAAAFVYEGPARALVTACKFRSLRSLAREMALLAGPAFVAACGGQTAGLAAPAPGAAVADPGLAVTWVPAHRTRTVERGFDQAELLAREFAGLAALPAVPLLRRTRATARQSGLQGAERAANVSDAFQLRPGADRVLTGFKRVVVVDDVYTTGETLNHCASALSEAGVDPRAFTFARAVRRSSGRATRSPIPASSAHREAAFHAKERSR